MECFAEIVKLFFAKRYTLFLNTPLLVTLRNDLSWYPDRVKSFWGKRRLTFLILLVYFLLKLQKSKANFFEGKVEYADDF